MRPLLFLPLLLTAAACASTPAETARSTARAQATDNKLAAQLAGLTPGPATTCLPLTARSGNLQTKGYGSTILYTVSRDLVYRNETTGGCENIARGDALVTVQPEGRACRGDIVTTFDTASRTTTGSCALGDFVPYRRAK